MDGSITFAAFASTTIGNNKVLNILLMVIVKTKEFTRMYKKWHPLPNIQKTLNNTAE